MTNTEYRLTIGALLVAVAVLAGCGTTRQAITAPEDAVRKIENEGVSMTLRYVDDAALKQDFGTGANPFLTEYYRLSFRRILVFEVTLRNESGSPVEFENTRCELDYGSKRIEATNRFQLGNYWESLEDDMRIVNKQKKLIERWVLPNKAKVADGGTLFGYVVFMGNLPRTGEATVYLPVFREGGSLSFQASYTF